MRAFEDLPGEPRTPCVYVNTYAFNRCLWERVVHHLNPRPPVAAISLPELVGLDDPPSVGLPKSLATRGDVVGAVYEMSDGTLPQSLLDWPGQCVITSYSSGDDSCAHATALWVVLYHVRTRIRNTGVVRHIPEVNTDDYALLPFAIRVIGTGVILAQGDRETVKTGA